MVESAFVGRSHGTRNAIVPFQDVLVKWNCFNVRNWLILKLFVFFAKTSLQVRVRDKTLNTMELGVLTKHADDGFTILKRCDRCRNKHFNY